MLQGIRWHQRVNTWIELTLSECLPCLDMVQCLWQHMGCILMPFQTSFHSAFSEKAKLSLPLELGAILLNGPLCGSWYPIGKNTQIGNICFGPSGNAWFPELPDLTDAFCEEREGRVDILLWGFSNGSGHSFYDDALRANFRLNGFGYGKVHWMHSQPRLSFDSNQMHQDSLSSPFQWPELFMHITQVEFSQVPSMVPMIRTMTFWANAAASRSVGAQSKSRVRFGNAERSPLIHHG